MPSGSTLGTGLEAGHSTITWLLAGDGGPENAHEP